MYHYKLNRILVKHILEKYRLKYTFLHVYYYAFYLFSTCTPVWVHAPRPTPDCIIFIILTMDWSKCNKGLCNQSGICFTTKHSHHTLQVVFSGSDMKWRVTMNVERVEVTLSLQQSLPDVITTGQSCPVQRNILFLNNKHIRGQHWHGVLIEAGVAPVNPRSISLEC